MNKTFHKIAWPVALILFMLSIQFRPVIWVAIGWLIGTCIVAAVELCWHYYRRHK